jgi:hypothetical protein
MEKRFLKLLVMLMLMACATVLPAQSPASSSPPSVSEAPTAIYLEIGSAQEPVIWYVEKDAISNEFGEMVLEFKGATVDSFFSLLEEIDEENHFTAFNPDRQTRTLSISDEGKSSQTVLAELLLQLNR